MRVEWKAFTFSMAFAKTVASRLYVCECVCQEPDQYALSSSIFTFHTIPPARIRMGSLKASASNSYRTKIELETKAHKTWTSVTHVVVVVVVVRALFTTIGPQRAARKHKESTWREPERCAAINQARFDTRLAFKFCGPKHDSNKTETRLSTQPPTRLAAWKAKSSDKCFDYVNWSCLFGSNFTFKAIKFRDPRGDILFTFITALQLLLKERSAVTR